MEDSELQLSLQLTFHNTGTNTSPFTLKWDKAQGVEKKVDMPENTE